MDAVLPEELISQIVDALVRLVEGAGAIVIISGVAIAFVRLLWTGLRERTTASFVPVRLAAQRSEIADRKRDRPRPAAGTLDA